MENNNLKNDFAIDYCCSLEDMKKNIENKCRNEKSKALVDKYLMKFMDFFKLPLFLQVPYLQDVPHDSEFFTKQKEQDTEDKITPDWRMNYPHFSNILSIFKAIRIEIVDEEPQLEENAIIDPLGAYYSTGGEKRKEPYIKIWFTKIYEQDDNKVNEEHFKWWFAKVLFHEMSHAILDTYNYKFVSEEQTDKLVYSSKTYKGSDGNEHYSVEHNIEEAMANALTAYYLKYSGCYDYIKDTIIRNQPEGYNQGIKFFELRLMDIAEYVYSKRNGVDDSIKNMWKEIMEEPYWRCPLKEK